MFVFRNFQDPTLYGVAYNRTMHVAKIVTEYRSVGDDNSLTENYHISAERRETIPLDQVPLDEWDIEKNDTYIYYVQRVFGLEEHKNLLNIK